MDPRYGGPPRPKETLPALPPPPPPRRPLPPMEQRPLPLPSFTCYTCGEAGHISPQCPNCPPGPTTRMVDVDTQVNPSSEDHASYEPDIASYAVTRAIKRARPEPEPKERQLREEWAKEKQEVQQTVDRVVREQRQLEPTNSHSVDAASYVPITTQLPTPVVEHAQLGLGDRIAALIMEQPVHLTVQELFTLAPYMSDLVCKAARGGSPTLETVDIGALAAQTPPLTDWDEEIPTVMVTIGQHVFEHSPIDGGSGVNLIEEETFRKLGLGKPSPAPFLVRMADQRVAQPTGIVRNVPMRVGELDYRITLVILKIERSKRPYQVLLGRPWLKEAKAKHDWESNELTIQQGKRCVTLGLDHKLPVRATGRPLRLEGYGWAEGLTPEQEHALFDGNPDLVEIAQADLLMLSPQGMENAKVLGLSEKFIQSSPDNIVESDQKLHEHTKKELEVISHEKTEEVDLSKKPAKQCIVKIAVDLPQEFRAAAIKLLQQYQDVFAWSYEDLKGVPPELAMHRIELLPNAVPIKQRAYRMNPTLLAQVKIELDKLLKVGFIYPIENAEWLSPVVVVPKKNGKLRICVNYKKLNDATKKDVYPIPFTDELLDSVAEHEMYSFLDGFSGYNQVTVAPEDQEKTAFISPWGAYAYRVMPFGLCNAPFTF